MSDSEEEVAAETPPSRPQSANPRWGLDWAKVALDGNLPFILAMLRCSWYQFFDLHCLLM